MSHPYAQTKIVSFVEASLNTASGFIVSLLAWQFLVAPLFGYTVTWETNFYLTGIFTIISIVRSYLWRRFFERRLWRILRLRMWMR